MVFKNNKNMIANKKLQKNKSILKAAFLLIESVLLVAGKTAILSYIITI